MGSVVEVNCLNCGLMEEHFVGAGMLDFRTNCSFPFACHDCQSVVTINRFDTIHQCPICKSKNVQAFDHPDLQATKVERVVVDWGEYSLSAGVHYCPACNHNALQFKQGLLFD